MFVFFKKLIVVLVVLNVHSCFAQVVSIEYVLDSPIERKEPLNMNTLEFYQTALAVDFNKWYISDTATLRRLNSKTIYKIELVYSSYKESDKFSQRKLNERRLVELKKKLPNMFENSAIEWSLIEQIEDVNKPRAKSLFHGFIFYSRESAMMTSSGLKKMTTEDEIAYVKSLLKSEELKEMISTLPEERCFHKVIQNCAESKLKFLPILKKKRKKGILYEKRSIWGRKPNKSVPVCIESDTLICVSTGGERDSLMKSLKSLRAIHSVGCDPLTTFTRQEDTIVAQTLNSKNWSNVLVIEDVTGSMYPYLGQTLLWRKFHSASGINDFTFFNDGDGNPDGPIGRSGGAVYISSSEIKKVELESYANMAKGSGGQAPENNIEATLYGLDNCKDSVEYIVWIADNYANIRDYKLIEKLKQTGYPVEIILCGVYSHHINVEYLQLALETNGSVYTMEQSFTNLKELNEGEIIEVDSQKFKIKKGVFVLVR